MKPLVYVAAPLTDPEPMENTHRAIGVASDLLRSGLVVPFLPHLTCLWHLVEPQPYETWIDYDLGILAHCDALLRVEGASAGADREAAEARRLGLPVFRHQADLFAWAIRLGPMDALRRGVAESAETGA